jgi:hypothetical protein
MLLWLGGSLSSFFSSGLVVLLWNLWLGGSLSSFFSSVLVVLLWKRMLLSLGGSLLSFFFSGLLVLFGRGVADSPTRRVGESAIECLKENSRSSVSRRFVDSPTRRVGELAIYRTLNGQTSPLKDQFGKKESRDVILSLLIYLKVRKKGQL